MEYGLEVKIKRRIKGRRYSNKEHSYAFIMVVEISYNRLYTVEEGGVFNS